MPTSVATRSKAWVYGRSLAGIVGSNPAGGHGCVECCVLSGRGLCDGLITRPEKSPIAMRRCVWFRNFVNGEVMTRVGPQRHKKKRLECSHNCCFFIEFYQTVNQLFNEGYIFSTYWHMKISWTNHVRNEEVLIRVDEQRNILHEIRKRKANWIGHILRRNCLLQQVIEGKIKGTHRSDKKTRKKA